MRAFGQLALDSPALLVFGRAIHPLTYGLGLSIGQGEVVPEVKYFPRRLAEKDPEGFKQEVKSITEDILERAVELGVKALQIETEQSFMETRAPRYGGEIAGIQKSILEKYADEYGMRLGLRFTVADIRDNRDGMRGTSAYTTMIEAFESTASNGADLLSIESEGGKDVFNYSVVRQDLKGIIFSAGLLGSLDMENLWADIVKACTRAGTIPAGDTACATGNTAMSLAGGMRSMSIPHTLAAMVRAIAASRSLVAYEQGARGPGKDCGYENVIVKAITGYPMSMEGKTSACAHSSLLGNVAAASCDLWSNEQVENVRLFSGSAPQAFLEMLHYDCELMNAAIKAGKDRDLRDMLVQSDRFNDPQAFVLSPDIAIELGRSIVGERGYYRRARSACAKAIELMASTGQLNLSAQERRFLSSAGRIVDQMPDDEEAFRDQMTRFYAGKVATFRESDYWP